MKKIYRLPPAKPKELNFEDFRAEINQAWERRAKELQARRWQIIKDKERQRRLVR